MNKKVEREEMELMALKECCSYKLQYSYKLFLYLWLVKNSRCALHEVAKTVSRIFLFS